MNEQLNAAALLILNYLDALDELTAAKKAHDDCHDTEAPEAFKLWTDRVAAYAKVETWETALNIFDGAIGGNARNMAMRLENRLSDPMIAVKWLAGEISEPLND